jgi:hypothetical protein
MPEQIKTRRMTVAQALKFSEAESKRFVEENPDYSRFKCDTNSKVILDYLFQQGVQIPDVEAYKIAFERCRYLGLLLETEPAPEPVTVEQPEPAPESQPTEELTPGWDIETGQPRQYSQREIHHMGADDYKKAFKLWHGSDGVDRRPLLNRSRYL